MSYIGGEKIVLEYYFKRYPEVDMFSTWDHATFIWKGTSKGFDQYNRLDRQGGLFNHFENNRMITTKDGLFETLRKYHLLHCVPFTKIYKKNGNVNGFLENMNDITYIIKPCKGFGGFGIKIANNRQDLHKLLRNSKTDLIVQSYLRRSLLYEGRKFDLRVLVLVDQHLKVHFYNEHYARVNPLKHNSRNHETVITNIGQVGEIMDSREVLKEHYEEVDEKIKNIVKNVFCEDIIRDLNNNHTCSFELYGLDFMINEEDLRVYLIEINQYPTMGNSPIFKKLINSMFDIILENGDPGLFIEL